MKALSVKEPWASMIMFFGKDTENRSWYTSQEGPLVICASKTVEPGWTQEAWKYQLESAFTERGLDIPFRLRDMSAVLNPGFALGTVILTGCDRLMKSEWDEEDQYHFRLVNPQPFETPFRQKGQLGFFDIDMSLITAARRPSPF